MKTHVSKGKIEKNIEGSRNIFFGALAGIAPSFKVGIPNYVYHYTTTENFKAILSSKTIRLYTVANFEDPNERKIPFKIEENLFGTLEDKSTGSKFDFKTEINRALSYEQVFIQSNSYDDCNDYLWKEYGEDRRGVCLKLSTAKYLKTINSLLNTLDSKIVPNEYKCFSVVYDPSAFDPFLEKVKDACFASDLKVDDGAKSEIKLFWFFWVEYLRNFIKTAEFSQEKEIRFIVSDYYSIYLFVMSVFARFPGNFPDCDGKEMSARFFEEYSRRKNIFYEQMNFQEYGDKKFVTVPLYSVLTSVQIGANSSFTKEQISELSERKIQKKNITKSFSS